MKHPRAKLLLLLIFAAVICALILLHWHAINGPWYWKWPWRRAYGLPLYSLMILAGAPVLAGQWIRRSTALRRACAILLLTAGTLALRYASVFVLTDPPSFDLIPVIIQSPEATSYYNDALKLRHFPGWFGAYDQILQLPGLSMHTLSKPPGPVLFFATTIQLFGDGVRGMHIAAAVMGILAALGIPASYLMLRRLEIDENSAFTGASFLSLCPGFVLFFPMFDPMYLLISCGLVGFWVAAVRGRTVLSAMAMGILLALSCIVTFGVLVVGFFCAVYPWVIRDRPILETVRIVARQAVIVFATTGLILGALFLLTGYDPIATFHSAWTNQHALLARYADQRPYPMTILFDLTDFALGSGWISFVLVIYCIMEVRGRQRALVWLALAQLVMVAVAGLLQSETARVWNFMLPLLMIPIGLELGRWPRGHLVAVLGALLIITCVICQNMKFIF